jgi:hypothetical protein
MKIQIVVEYQDNVYATSSIEATEQDIEITKELIKKAVEGSVSHISLLNKDVEYFIPKSILENSVILLVIS